MALTAIDRHLLQRCLERKPRAWEDFVDRFIGLVIHVTDHSARAWGFRLAPEDREDLSAEVFLNLVRDDFAVLRHFRGQSSLATYLTVVARRVVVKSLLRRRTAVAALDPAAARMDGNLKTSERRRAQQVEDREEVERLLEGLGAGEARVVRMYHLEEKTYGEISRSLGIPENSVGPILSRARAKMRRAGARQRAAVS